ncbi:unnamed protein product [Mycena citricolor]|uniref:Uncharacterized protein n=1 Tax=Mycena citricolor TaxID=2018698 RepID=A0AAD2Q5H3_9AGAR|nr:unnamed protein product [Mycena citricolor]
MVDALKWAALHLPRDDAVKTETQAVAWTMRSLSDDLEFGPFVEGLAEALWDFDRREPCGAYRAHFKILLRDQEAHLGQRLADFMAGSNSYILEPKDRFRRQVSVLRAIWAVCAFSLHTGSPLQSPIGDADVDNVLLGSKFIDSDDMQSMVLSVSALTRLNMIEYRSRQQDHTQTSSSDAEAEKQKQVDIHWTYTDYLVALSKCATSFQRNETASLFNLSEMRFTEANGYETLHLGLIHLINLTSDETADNLVFAARMMISPFAQTSEYSWWVRLHGLGPFLVQHPSLAVSDPKSDSQPSSRHHYTRYLCHSLSRNLELGFQLQPSVDALQLIYRNLVEADVPPKDLETHLLVLRTLWTDVCTHRLAAIVQCVVLKCFREDFSGLVDLSEWEQLPRMFADNDWFCSALGLDNDKRTERASAQQIHYCARVGVFTTFFKQCTARSPDQDERDLDWATLKLVYAFTLIDLVIPTSLQRRFADAASGFIRKYPKNCLADSHRLYSVLYWAVEEGSGYITNVDALRVLDTAVSEVQTEEQQESHRFNAEWIRGWMEERLLLPEDNFAAFVSLVSDGEQGDHC